MASEKLLLDRREILPIADAVRRRGGKSLEECGRSRRVGDSRRTRPREEQRKKIGARRRQLDRRLVHQVLDHVLPADVGDDRQPRSEGDDVGEVLVRSDTEVHRSEEHTSELQSRRDLVCRLLLEKKKKKENR